MDNYLVWTSDKFLYDVDTFSSGNIKEYPLKINFKKSVKDKDMLGNILRAKKGLLDRFINRLTVEENIKLLIEYLLANSDDLENESTIEDIYSLVQSLKNKKIDEKYIRYNASNLCLWINENQFKIINDVLNHYSVYTVYLRLDEYGKKDFTELMEIFNLEKDEEEEK